MALTGYIVQAAGSFTMLPMVGAALSLIGAALYWLALCGPITVVDLFFDRQPVIRTA